MRRGVELAPQLLELLVRLRCGLARAQLAVRNRPDVLASLVNLLPQRVEAVQHVKHDGGNWYAVEESEDAIFNLSKQIADKDGKIKQCGVNSGRRGVCAE